MFRYTYLAREEPCRRINSEKRGIQLFSQQHPCTCKITHKLKKGKNAIETFCTYIHITCKKQRKVNPIRETQKP
jgi:cytochrome c peroxidase